MQNKAILWGKGKQKKNYLNHRTHQTSSALLESLSKELLLPYVRYCLNNHLVPSSTNFNSWIESSQSADACFMFYYHSSFSYLLVFNLYIEGTQKNNSEEMQVACVEFSPLFYAFNNTKYQHLHLRDMCQRERYPEDIRDYVNMHESLNNSLTHDAAQDADFIQEEMNKMQMSFLPPTMPTAETWQRVSRNTTNLCNIKNNALKVTTTSKRHKLFDNNVPQRDTCCSFIP